MGGLAEPVEVFLEDGGGYAGDEAFAFREFPESSGTNPVGSVEAFFFRLWRLSISFTGSSIVYFVLAAISSRISCLASRQRGMSILVPMTSTTLAAMMDPTSPQTRRGIPREWAYRKPAA